MGRSRVVDRSQGKLSSDGEDGEQVVLPLRYDIDEGEVIAKLIFVVSCFKTLRQQLNIFRLTNEIHSC